MSVGEDDATFDETLALLAPLAHVLPEVRPSASARASLLERLRGPARFAPFASEIAAAFDAPLPAVLSALSRIDDPTAWLGPVPGARVLPLHGRVVVSRLPAGTRIPHHQHATRELTYVLDGTLISDDTEHQRGACLDMAPGTGHALRIGDADECLVVFTSLLPDAGR